VDGKIGTHRVIVSAQEFLLEDVNTQPSPLMFRKDWETFVAVIKKPRNGRYKYEHV